MAHNTEMTAAEHMAMAAVENELTTEREHGQAVLNAWGNRCCYVDGNSEDVTTEEFEAAFKALYGWAL
jgi:hypothetical protein